jgi:hypothetical protein
LQHNENSTSTWTPLDTNLTVISTEFSPLPEEGLGKPTPTVGNINFYLNLQSKLLFLSNIWDGEKRYLIFSVLGQLRSYAEFTICSTNRELGADRKKTLKKHKATEVEFADWFHLEQGTKPV